MTIGPDPMIRIEWRSSRLGIRPPAHDRVELVEQISAVVRPGPCFGMMFDAEAALAHYLHSFADAVVEVDMRHAGLFAERAERVGVDREVVILARDLDPAGADVAHRM